jgi:hypothetical protein
MYELGNNGIFPRSAGQAGEARKAYGMPESDYLIVEGNKGNALRRKPFEGDSWKSEREKET